MALTIVAAVVAFAPSAFGSITVDASTTYGSTVPGAHTDYTIRQDFTYDANGPEPTASTGAGQDLKKWIVDSPAGLVGNPNAVPYADRCDPASFDPTPGAAAAYSTFFIGSCPASSKVGDASVYLVNDAESGTCPNANPIICLTAGFDMANLGTPLLGSIYILKTDPEIPTTLGTQFTSLSYQNFDFSGFGGSVCTTAPGTPCPIQPKTKSVLAPVTNRSDTNHGNDDDFRIRTIPADYSTPPTALLPTAYGHAALPGTPLHIRRIDQHLYGLANNGEPFLTMPTRCDSWDSYAYAIPWNTGDGTLAMDPNHTGDNTYVKSAADSVSPDCSTVPAFGTTASAALSTGARGAYPGLTVKVGDPSPSGHDETKKMVTTLPDAVSVNVNALNNVCSEADRNADTCPAASQIGTASISTPLISGGLTGRVYMVQGTTPGLPFLSIFVDGAVKFRLDATTKFVGPNFNMIETTFDNLPQTPFTDFTVNITGGSSTSSLLFNRSCPTDGTAPGSGSTTFSLTGYAGGAVSSSSSNSFDGCYGISNPSKIKNCVKQGKRLSVSPKGVIDKPGISKIQLLVGSKAKNVMKRATDTKSPYKFKLTMKKSKYKKNRSYYYAYKVWYKDGKVVKTKTNKFKVCK
ncbi:MAG: hypothetical protein JHC98_08175 [Thermoleophilaceae bacterium]|nr:hypothetical protein [Thermoleophilaceae bacterium]